MPPFPSVHGQTQPLWETESARPTPPISQKITRFTGPEAARNATVTGLVSRIFNESFGYRPDGRPYRLGPKSTAERLASTDLLFIAGDEQSGIGYLFGKEIPSMGGRIAWIESMAVLPLYRRQGIATALVRKFRLATKGSSKIGCATPNPIAALVVTRAVPGTVYIGNCHPPSAVVEMLCKIQQHCFDLRGCAIQKNTLQIKTGFSPLSRSDERKWNPRTPSSPPHWWSELEHLPNTYEALLVIEREDSPAMWEI
ncbi:MAG: GNAT family N-acetyltransferase [Nitrospira sp. SB0661_bin_20]|nr:GNAT family N-acetyltransferase [Nitrospira sp. SB0661_bin_20]MYJ22104.1 GNAT family N-acetyltransferase [Nitrospira sp. SB0673_bin_12]